MCVQKKGFQQGSRGIHGRVGDRRWLVGVQDDKGSAEAASAVLLFGRRRSSERRAGGCCGRVDSACALCAVRFRPALPSRTCKPRRQCDFLLRARPACNDGSFLRIYSKAHASESLVQHSTLLTQSRSPAHVRFARAFTKQIAVWQLGDKSQPRPYAQGSRTYQYEDRGVQLEYGISAKLAEGLAGARGGEGVRSSA